MAVAVIFTIAATTIVPFVAVYTNGINDIDYVLPVFGVLLTIAYAIRCLRIPYFVIVKAAGHFKQTQNGAFISAGLNVFLSIVLVFEFGLVGVAIGTLASMIYHTFYFVWYLRKNIINRSPLYFIKHIVVDVGIGAATALLTQNITMTELTYLSWIVYAIEIAGVTVVTAAIIGGLANYKSILVIIKKLRKKA